MSQDLSAGSRVEIAPHYDRWMMGDGFGRIIGFRPGEAKVQLEKSKRRGWFPREHLTRRG